MPRPHYNIAIAGCGVAGLAGALFLNRAGHRVTLFDQLKAPAPLGSGLLLQPTGLAVLEALGLQSDIYALGHRIERLHGRALPSDRMVLDVRYSALTPQSHGIAIHRAALFDTLFNAVTHAAIAIETDCKVVGTDLVAAHQIELVCETGRRFGPFDLAIDALGIHSPLAQRTGSWLPFGALCANVDLPKDAPFAPHALDQRYRGAYQMAGVLPIGRRQAGAPAQAAFFWSLKAQDYANWQTQPLEHWRDDVARLWPQAAGLIAPLDRHDCFVFARYQHSTLRRPFSQSLVHIGDAAHSTSPQLGQGANMALLDAAALAEALETTSKLQEALSLYASARRLHVQLYQTLSLALTPLYQSQSAFFPALRDWLFAPLAKIPPMPHMLASLVAGHIGLPAQQQSRTALRAPA